MPEAIDMVRRELGPDAIIVSSHVNEMGRTVVSAAVETSPHARDDVQAPRSVAAISAVPSLELELEQRLRDRLRAIPLGKATSPASPHSGIAFDATRLADALSAQAVPTALRDALVNAATAFRDDDAVAALARALEARLTFRPLATAPRAPIMLVGLPGAGKTVTMAKLAAAAVMEGLEIDLISTDASRVGAIAQGTAYADLLSQALKTADSADALGLLLEERAANGNNLPDRSSRPCFIDTASANPFDRVEWEALTRLTDRARLVADAEPVLVLAATGDAELMTEAATHFAVLGARRLIATQVDVSRRIGPILAAADASRLSLAQISVTPYLAQGLSPMHPIVCAKLLLSSYDKRPGESHIRTTATSGNQERSTR
jgi:flagellar biosynthesis protein FlhF